MAKSTSTLKELDQEPAPQKEAVDISDLRADIERKIWLETYTAGLSHIFAGRTPGAAIGNENYFRSQLESLFRACDICHEEYLRHLNTK